MAIPWPADIRPSTATFWLEANTVITTSPLSRASQVLIRQGARWRCDMTFNSRNAAISGRLDALLAQLDGSGGEVTLFDFRRPVPRGTAALQTNPIVTTFDDGTEFDDGYDWLDYYAAQLPIIDTAAAGEEFIVTRGWGPLEHNVLLAGDYIGVNGYLYMVLSATRADANGKVTLQIRPRMRATATTGDAVTIIQPTARFRLADNGQGANRTQPGMFSSYTVSFMESLP